MAKRSPVAAHWHLHSSAAKQSTKMLLLQRFSGKCVGKSASSYSYYKKNPFECQIFSWLYSERQSLIYLEGPRSQMFNEKHPPSLLVKSWRFTPSRCIRHKFSQVGFKQNNFPRQSSFFCASQSFFEIGACLLQVLKRQCPSYCP